MPPRGPFNFAFFAVGDDSAVLSDHVGLAKVRARAARARCTCLPLSGTHVTARGSYFCTRQLYTFLKNANSLRQCSIPLDDGIDFEMVAACTHELPPTFGCVSVPEPASTLTMPRQTPQIVGQRLSLEWCYAHLKIGSLRLCDALKRKPFLLRNSLTSQSSCPEQRTDRTMPRNIYSSGCLRMLSCNY